MTHAEPDAATADDLAAAVRHLMTDPEHAPHVERAVGHAASLLGGLSFQGLGAATFALPLWAALATRFGLGPFPPAYLLAATERLSLTDAEAATIAATAQRLGLLSLTGGTLALQAPGPVFRALLTPSRSS